MYYNHSKLAVLEKLLDLSPCASFMESSHSIDLYVSTVPFNKFYLDESSDENSEFKDLWLTFGFDSR